MLSVQVSHKPQKQQKTKRDKTPQYNAIPPLLRPNPPNQTIKPGNLTRRPHDPPIDTRQRLPLRAETLIDRIRLTQHPIRNTMAPVDPIPLLEHVVRLGVGGVRIPVGGDVGADGGEEIGALAGIVYGGFQPDELAAVVEEDFAVAGQVVGFEGRGGEGGFGVEETVELGDEGFSLREGKDVSAERFDCMVLGNEKAAGFRLPFRASLGWLPRSAVRRL